MKEKLKEFRERLDNLFIPLVEDYTKTWDFMQNVTENVETLKILLDKFSKEVLDFVKEVEILFSFPRMPHPFLIGQKRFLGVPTVCPLKHQKLYQILRKAWMKW